MRKAVIAGAVAAVTLVAAGVFAWMTWPSRDDESHVADVPSLPASTLTPSQSHFPHPSKEGSSPSPTPAAEATFDPVSPTPSDPPEEPARSIDPHSEDLPRLAQEISDLGADRGFATARLNYADNSMDVLWQGEVPQDIVDVAQKNPAGVEVRFRTDAKYSRSQINRGVQKISVPEWPSGTVGVAPADDYSGIILEIEGDLPPSTKVVRDLERRSGLDIAEVKLNQPPPLWPTDAP